MIIITKTPLRVSFFGGGTDYKEWIKQYGGAVLSTSIDKYSYLNVRRIPPYFPYKSRIVWSKIEDVDKIDEIIHPSVRETLRFMDFHDGIYVNYNGDVPALSGLGSSSSFTVGLLHAIYCLKGIKPDKKKLAEEAIHIEQNLIKENVGSQDQVASAYGGFNKIDFHKTGDITVSPVKISKKKVKDLERHMMLFFTGLTRKASEIVAEQIGNIPKKTKELHKMRTMVDEAMEIFSRDGDWLGDFGRLLHKSWEIKRSLSSKVSTREIDLIYEKARKVGALGGKLLGAGGGGFILIYARPEDQPKIRKELGNLICVPFTFENEGSKVIYKTE